jgi:hypothetical protein
VLEWLVFGVWIAPQPDLMYADCSYCDSGCVCSGGKGMLVVVVVVVLAKMAMAGV